MFGWGKQRVGTPQLNAGNPMCAEVFHPIFDRVFESERGFNHQFIFKLCKDEIEKHYVASKLARERGNHEQFKITVISVSIKALSAAASEVSISTSKDASNFGRSNALGTIGDIIFGFAPGLALQGPNEAHKIAKSMIQDFQVAIKWTAPNTYLHGAWQACSDFLAGLSQLEHGHQAGATSRRGEDVRSTVTVPLNTATQGGLARVVLPTGRMVEVKVPTGVKEGAQLRLRGQGRPGLNGGESGDALITIKIAPAPVPETYSKEAGAVA